MFHAKDGLFMGRLPSGDVLLVQYAINNPPPAAWPKVTDAEFPGAVAVVTVPAGVWASGVAHVSAWGEDGDSVRRALVFHNGVGKPSPEVLAQRIAAAQQTTEQVRPLMAESVKEPKS